MLGIPLVPVLSASHYSSTSLSAPLSSSFAKGRGGGEGGMEDLPYSNASHYLGQIKNVRLPLAKVRFYPSIFVFLSPDVFIYFSLFFVFCI